MEPNTNSVPSQKKHHYACVRCGERKVKCDRSDPCQACVRHHMPCIYIAPKPPRRRQKIIKDDDLAARLKRCEALLEQHGIDPRANQAEQTITSTQSEAQSEQSTTVTSASAPQLPSPASTSSAPSSRVIQPQLIHGHGGMKLANNTLYTRVAQEMNENGGVSADEESSGDDADGPNAADDDFLYLLNQRTPSDQSLHPSPDVGQTLLEIFLENVDPMFKIIHVPTLRSAFTKAINTTNNIPKGFEALMFAIYSMAIVSLPANDCERRLGASKTTLHARFVAATKGALARAKFLTAPTLVVMQALVLHLFSIRETYEPRAIWALTGLVIRIAQGMGMRFDGTLLGLPPFETEMRRRVWWALQMHEFRAEELSGQPKLKTFGGMDESTPKLPCNINDTDLWPGMTEPPTPSDRPTEMLWIMFRGELTSLASRQIARMRSQHASTTTTTTTTTNTTAGTPSASSSRPLNPEEFIMVDDEIRKGGILRDMEEALESKYTRYCDPTNPLHLVTLIGTRLSVRLMTFLSHHPRRWATMPTGTVSDAERDLVWNTVVALLEQYNMLQTTPVLERFRWNVSYFIQWSAVIHVLDTLRAEPLREDADKAWRLLDVLYDSNADILLGLDRPVFMAVGNLCLKAFAAREVAWEERLGRGAKLVVPFYVQRLSEQRTAAKKRREAAAAAKIGRQKLQPAVAVAAKPEVGAELPVMAVPLSTHHHHHHHHQQQQQQQLDPMSDNFNNNSNNDAATVPNEQYSDGAYWLSDVLHQELADPEVAAGSAGFMDVDTDAMLAQGLSLDTPGGGVVDWAQWDAFFGRAPAPGVAGVGG